MKKIIVFNYTLIVLVNVLPFIPASLKGILGIILISYNAIKFSNKHVFITTSIFVFCGLVNNHFGISTDFRSQKTLEILGVISLICTAFIIGKSAEILRQRNIELHNEIMKREKIQKELEDKITFIQNLMDTMPSPLYFKELDGKFIGCNRSFEDSIGIVSKDLVGKSFYDLFDFEFANECNSMDLELIKDNGKQAYETIVKYSDNSYRNIILNKSIFTDESMKPAGIIGVITDITDKREKEKLKENVDQMLEKDKFKTEFFSNVSHELRTPLNVILSSIQVLEVYSKKSFTVDQLNNKITVMKKNCFRLLRLINNLIDSTKIDAQAFELHLVNCNIVNIIKEITLSVSSYIENKGINLIFDTDTEEKIIACDEEKVERIMLNVLSNAIKFTPKGGSIYVKIHDYDNTLCVSVSDTGIGIPQDKVGEIFQRFCQINSMFTRQHEGSGIGLSIVKSLVEMHKGSVTVESELGKGTTLNIKLPAFIIEEKASKYTQFDENLKVEKINVEFSDIYL